jgi:hypothetical protein
MSVFAEAIEAQNVDEFAHLLDEHGLIDALDFASVHEIEQEVKATFYHGSPNWSGESFNMDLVGKSESMSDAKGVGFYLTSDLSSAKNYAGKEGTVVTTELSFAVDEVETYLAPSDRPDLIKKAILASPLAYEFFSDNYIISDYVPSYDADSGSYMDKTSGNEVECHFSEYLERFGGLERMFTNRDNYDPVARTSSPVQSYIKQIMRCDTLHEALLRVEEDFYYRNCAFETPENKQENIDLAKQLVDLKIQNGIKLALHVETDDLFTATVYDASVIEVKEIKKLEQTQALKLKN